jgi:type IV pilus assembly protein PilN
VRPINLATRTFRNERLPATAFVVAVVVLLALTAWHAVAVGRLLPGRTSALHQEVARLEAEVRDLRGKGRTLRRENPPASTVARWTLVKDIVDQRAFSWSGLFERLEAVIPDGVRLTSIEPTVRKGQIVVTISATVREPEDGWAFVRALEQSGDFADVFPTSETDEDFQYVMRYRPRPRTAAAPPAPLASPEPEGEAS